MSRSSFIGVLAVLFLSSASANAALITKTWSGDVVYLQNTNSSLFWLGQTLTWSVTYDPADHGVVYIWYDNSSVIAAGYTACGDCVLYANATANFGSIFDSMAIDASGNTRTEQQHQQYRTMWIANHSDGSTYDYWNAEYDSNGGGRYFQMNKPGNPYPVVFEWYGYDYGHAGDSNYAAYSYIGLNNLTEISAVPVPAAAWLLGSGLLALAGISRRGKAQASAS